MTRRTKNTLTIAASLSLAAATPASAGITATGDVNPNPPVAGQGVDVGDSGVGSLTIDAGSSFSTGTAANDQSVEIGAQASGDGTVLIDGFDSILETNFLRVGVAGTALFTASNEAVVMVANDFSISGDNTATVTDDGTLFQAGDSIFLNGPTAATLNVKDMATFEILPTNADNRFFIGSQAGQKGVVNITGEGSLVFSNNGTAPFRTFVGTQHDTAQGELNILSGGNASLGRIDVGNDSDNNGASGVINVGGPFSFLNVVQTVTGDSTGNGAGDINLGTGGHGVLNITGGAAVNVADDIFVALGDESSGQLNVIDGTLGVGDGLFVGYNGTGPLTIGTGGEVTTNRFIVTNTDTNTDITPGDAVVTFELSKDSFGDELNGLISTKDFSFRSGTRSLILDLEDPAAFELDDVFLLVDYDTIGQNLNGAVTTQVFDNVGDDQTIVFEGVEFLIDYNDPNSSGTALTATVVTVIPTPGSLALLGLGGLLVLARRGQRAGGESAAGSQRWSRPAAV